MAMVGAPVAHESDWLISAASGYLFRIAADSGKIVAEVAIGESLSGPPMIVGSGLLLPEMKDCHWDPARGYDGIDKRSEQAMTPSAMGVNRYVRHGMTVVLWMIVILGKGIQLESLGAQNDRATSARRFESSILDDEPFDLITLTAEWQNAQVRVFSIAFREVFLR